MPVSLDTNWRKRGAQDKSKGARFGLEVRSLGKETKLKFVMAAKIGGKLSIKKKFI